MLERTEWMVQWFVWWKAILLLSPKLTVGWQRVRGRDGRDDLEEGTTLRKRKRWRGGPGRCSFLCCCYGCLWESVKSPSPDGPLWTRFLWLTREKAPSWRRVGEAVVRNLHFHWRQGWRDQNMSKGVLSSFAGPLEGRRGGVNTWMSRRRWPRVASISKKRSPSLKKHFPGSL